MIRNCRDHGRGSRFVFGLVAWCAWTAAISAEWHSGGPFVPTPQPVVEEMLELAGVGPDDFVVDLGSGDGRIVLTAASRYRARGRGIDIDGELVESSTNEARRQGLDALVKFSQEDVLKARFSEATVLTLYLLPELLSPLRDRIIHELRPGARVVAHDFAFLEWTPDRTISVDVPEKYGRPGAWQSTLYLWVVPATVGGRWQAVIEGPQNENFILSLEQKFQRLEGHIARGGERIPVQDGALNGAHIRFAFTESKSGRKVRREFTGTVEGAVIRGGVAWAEGMLRWSAARIDTAARARQ
ncbi:MAG: methyltransferase domain-containing protein [Betaproteobacteria bacterium]|nr:methyltransferase domain-containing protein [Betaproteobacteria bacterium]